MRESNLSQQNSQKISQVAAASPNIFTGVAPPTIDETDGAKIGSLFIDTTNAKAYICIDPTDGAPDWNQID